MSSGKYSALSGAIGRLNMLDTISDNLANTGTVGFKKGQAVFEAKLRQAVADRVTKGINYTRLQQGFTNFAQGTLNKSGSPLHLGIEGEGFFKLRDPDGSIFYSRQGNFMLNPQGLLQTPDGLTPLDVDNQPIVLPRPDLEINPEGAIALPDGDPRRLALVSFPEEAQLVRSGSGRFTLASDHTEQPVTQTQAQIIQGRLEQSNVNATEEMGRMVDTLRSFEALQKVLMTYSEIGKTGNELGVLG